MKNIREILLLYLIFFLRFFMHSDLIFQHPLNNNQMMDTLGDELNYSLQSIDSLVKDSERYKLTDLIII